MAQVASHLVRAMEAVAAGSAEADAPDESEAEGAVGDGRRKGHPSSWERAYAEHDPTTRPQRQWEFIQQATDDRCTETLAATDAAFTALPPETAPNVHGCGIPRGVLLTRGPTGMAYSPPLRIDCSLALRLVELETIVTEESERHLGAPVVRIGTRGSYNCREVVGRLKGWSGGISEHSFGNAVDIDHFDTARGQRIAILQHYADATKPAGLFLRDVVRRTWQQAEMRALGPDFDSAHADHLHIDGGSRWWRWK